MMNSILNTVQITKHSLTAGFVIAIFVGDSLITNAIFTISSAVAFLQVTKSIMDESKPAG
ncbi:hypothetical protein QQF54_09005 [Lelliottia sp. V106_10]|uniref:hypothetical protein n=1 Tax=Enterobacteriaceae TaxID=543 RepID=UPI00106F7AC9|nr:MULTISPECIES: hypothetical protein [Enterobacteriaceae]MBM1023138.1 hypothetical protein [Enterobacter sp. E1]MDK9373492.1 hypothetical protein [Lelliottia sp. V106_10]MDK9600467.1 hypothetical protein [Lelliottia sp. V106_5]MEA3564459.1 hypothetical protein [Enterobacter sp. GM-22]MEA3598134.1 hypothetical protein [Enterobacter sp. GM-31]